MPFYKFKCSECEADVDLMIPMSARGDEFPHDQCGGVLKRFITSPPPATVTELGSKYHGKSMRKNIQEILKKRSRDDMMANVGDYIEKHGMDSVSRTSLLKNGKKRTVWDEK